jgi:hypothetical protein
MTVQVTEMDNNDLLKPLYELLERAQELIRLGLAEEWEAMDAAANKYQQHVTFLDDDVYLKAINDAHLVDDAKAIISLIQGLNEELDIHTSFQREKIASELRQINQSGKAIDAYGR